MSDEAWEVAEGAIKALAKLFGYVLIYLVGMAACAYTFMMALGNIHKELPSVPAVSYMTALWMFGGMSAVGFMVLGLRWVAKVSGE